MEDLAIVNLHDVFFFRYPCFEMIIKFSDYFLFKACSSGSGNFERERLKYMKCKPLSPDPLVIFFHFCEGQVSNFLEAKMMQFVATQK